jgi:GT2 family glycosyltransferase
LQKQCADYTPGHKDSKKFRGLVTTDAIVGCASIMRVDRLKKVGLSDPDFFYGEEDIELSQRLKNGNDSLIVDLNHKIYHFVSATVGTNWAKTIYYNYKYRLLLIKKIGTFSDKFFGYSICIIKLLISSLLIFNLKHSSRITQRYYGIKHFYQKKYGKYDRKNYNKIDNFFKKIDKKTNIMDVINVIFSKRKI